MAWHAIYCESQRELYARDRLTERGFEVFCPYEELKVPGKLPGENNKRSRCIALWPPYCFVNSQEFRAVTQTPGVLAFVKVSGTPTEVPSSLIHKLKDACDEEGRVGSVKDISKPSFWFKGKVGDQFEFNRKSPLQGFSATIGSTESMDEDGKIDVWLDFLGSARALRVPLNQVGSITVQLDPRASGDAGRPKRKIYYR